MSDSTSSASGTSASQHARIIGRGLDRGRGIEVAADRLDFLGDLARGAALGALERHVFEQMRNAVLVAVLVAAAGADPDAERGGFQMRHGVRHDGQTGRQTGYFDAHAAAPSRAAREAASTNVSICFWSAGSLVTCSRRSARPDSQSGSFGRTPQAASTASGNFAACAVESTIIGKRRIARLLLGDRDADRGMRIDEMPGLAKGRAHGGGNLVLAGAAGGKTAADFRQSAGRRSRSASTARRFFISAATGAAIAAIGLEQQPLEIRRHLDVHRGRGGGDDVARLIGAGGERAHQDVVDVGRDHQPIDRQAHAARDIACENVAEISGRHREGASCDAARRARPRR